MNELEERTAKASALLEFSEAKQRFAVLRNEAHGIAKGFDGLSKLLKERPETLSFDAADKDTQALMGYKRLGSLIDDLKKTRDELNRLAPLISQLGLSHLLHDKN